MGNHVNKRMTCGCAAAYLMPHLLLALGLHGQGHVLCFCFGHRKVRFRCAPNSWTRVRGGLPRPVLRAVTYKYPGQGILEASAH